MADLISLSPGDTLVLATHNAGKLAEMTDLLAPYDITVRGAAEAGLPEPEETGDTFEKNSALKALAAAKATGQIALSDDSGLCVTALDGAPGVYTADWAEKADGSGRDFAMAMQKVETALQEAGAREPSDRKAQFVCLLCLAAPDGRTEFFPGMVDGTLVWPPRGENGFGYDPVFQPAGHDRTFGEMDKAEKKGTVRQGDAGRADLGLSHRARALHAFIAAKLPDI
ncbi:RdgB/HAM1 family non-canonical purine NTP pyrophosphatase [Notoacmeibacter sp. MSK16QG-6]|uniref:RdgB/HAM1 family non-canonical purine NTP pyrophosphatase n=1 Tax=Notoacmeibacter sp. MSK16QG-6 TaxID=2957982 RepID=UPI00209D5738|nr:RdgB/HAM1 family non-canonical purine NTP pyrophosphatase [Notoacmeibacter sp. MSK16QG-6]MCP1198902.1 RdgB/HAM1 family non-canonical purine NTP pyrophosphatase [Notoacmeibacter sp. MSK16QG-6]